MDWIARQQIVTQSNLFVIRQEGTPAFSHAEEDLFLVLALPQVLPLQSVGMGRKKEPKYVMTAIPSIPIPAPINAKIPVAGME
ncbi:MAG: hypothetical protein Greene101449_654 [Candidatus Peregrinibacteria bacterium Greene1014_49]|nr:MAG: hypothetical protein Greene101449_654 [Candidatus Peregrinibacteria bacterium Greene1014_49]